MHKVGDTSPAYGSRKYWYNAISDPGSKQMIHLKTLMLSLPYFDRVPDQSIIYSDQGKRYDYIVATRGTNYALVYTYNGRNFKLKMGKIEGEKVNAYWYNPRNGDKELLGAFNNTGVKEFDPPGEKKDGNDWVLILQKA
jgi:hypothetical protein